MVFKEINLGKNIGLDIYHSKMSNIKLPWMFMNMHTMA